MKYFKKIWDDGNVGFGQWKNGDAINYNERNGLKIEFITEQDFIKNTETKDKYLNLKIIELKNEANKKIIDTYPLYKQININALEGYSEDDKKEMWDFINDIRKDCNEKIAKIEEEKTTDKSTKKKQ